MKDFRETNTYAMVREALQIAPPSEIARMALEVVAALPTLDAACKVGIELLVQRALMGQSQDWAQDMLRLPLYAPFAGVAAGELGALAPEQREALWMVVVGACRRVIQGRLARLQQVMEAAGDGSADLAGWVE